MEIQNFIKILQDPHFDDYQKMTYKYGEQFKPFLSDYTLLYLHELPLQDFNGVKMQYSDKCLQIKNKSMKQLLKSQDQKYGIQSAEDEIIATSAIEGIEFDRESVRKILKGYAPEDKTENRIFGLKKGLDFISDEQNQINEENLFSLYMLSVGNDLESENRLKAGCFYRHDDVYIVSDRLEHKGISADKLPLAMAALFDFINDEDDLDELLKAAIIHFYFAYIHPYFDGNGRMARLLHLWFLIQKGYQSTLFMPFSYQIEKNKGAYYRSFTQIEKNQKISEIIDVTPFLQFCIDKIYNRMYISYSENITERYTRLLKTGHFTDKETQLWQFVLMNYGTEPFSTKQLERDFGHAAYATIRGFVLKFEKHAFLVSQKYGTRVKYHVSKDSQQH